MACPFGQCSNSPYSPHGYPSLHDRLGGIFPIAAVVNKFSDALLTNPVVGPASSNPYLRAWSRTKAPTRLPGLKFQRTLWLAQAAGGPQIYVPTQPGATPLGLENAHCPLRITPAEFNAVAAELKKALQFYKVPQPEQEEVLALFAAHAPEVTAGASGMMCPLMSYS